MVSNFDCFTNGEINGDLLFFPALDSSLPKNFPMSSMMFSLREIKDFWPEVVLWRKLAESQHEKISKSKFNEMSLFHFCLRGYSKFHVWFSIFISIYGIVKNKN